MTIVHEEDGPFPLMTPSSQSFVVDPVLADTVDLGFDRVDVASPTTGPNRYTVHVPKEATVLSLGAPSPHWNTDVGITGYTESHVHFETKEKAKTIVSLGGPATTASLSGWDAAVPTQSQGYAMVTEESAWQDAKLQHYFLSREEDITLRTAGEGSRAILQAKGGFVDVNGGVEVNIAGGGVSIGAHTLTEFEEPTYAVCMAGDTPHSLAALRVSGWNNIAAALSTAHSLVTTAKKMAHEYKHGHLHRSVDTYADVVEWFADLGEFVNLSMEIHEAFSDEEAGEEQIKISAEMDLGGASGGECAFFGVKGATLGSAIWSGVSAGVAATLQGAVFGGVAGAYTSVKGYKSVEVASVHGKALFEAGRNVEVSADKNAFVVGDELVQVSSKHDMLVGGEVNTWFGTSAGGGWGMALTADGLKLGKASGATTMASASVAADRSIAIDSAGFTLTSAGTKYTQNDDGVTAKSVSVKLHAKDADVRVGGKKVLIDGP